MGSFSRRSHLCSLVLTLALTALGAAGQERLEDRYRISADHGLPSATVSCALRDSLGFLWLGTDDGLARWDGHRILVLAHDPDNGRSLSSDRVRTLYEDRSGHLWVGTDAGLNRLDREHLSFHRYPIDDPSAGTADFRIATMVEEALGRFWVGTLGGLYFFDPGTRRFTRLIELRGVAIRALILGQDGRLWIGTVQGLSSLPAGPQMSDLPRLETTFEVGPVSGLAFDRSQKLWISTDQGITVVDLEEHEILAKQDIGVVRDFALINGRVWASTLEELLTFPLAAQVIDGEILTRKVGPPVSWLSSDREGVLWAPSAEGVVGFDLAPSVAASAVSKAPRVKLTGLSVNGGRVLPKDSSSLLSRDISTVSSLELPAESQMVVFDLATLRFEYRESMRYSYRLLGLHDFWKETGGDWAQAVYSSIAPGTYTLESRASYDGVEWGETNRLSLEIQPPRRRAGALFVYAALVACVVLFLLRFRMLRQRRDRAVDLRLRELQQQKLESLSTLAGGVAHDFNNLLVGVFGHAELAKLQVGPDSAASQHLDRILTFARRAAELAKQMLFYSGHGNFLIEPLDVSALVREVGESLRPSVPDNVRLLIEPHPRLPRIEGDPGQLRQVLTNLVNNASEALKDREGFIVLGTAVRSVDESFLERHQLSDKLTVGDYVAITVDDTGSGIEEESLDKIFDPFFSTKSAGRGLGLAAAQGIARGHGGVVRVSSSPGRGSTFQVLLPTMSQAEATSPSGAQSALGGRGKVLVVDSEMAVRRQARSCFEKLGFDVLEASDRASTLAVFARTRARLSMVLLDVSSAKEGIETLRALKQLEPTLPIVLASPLPATEAAQRFGEDEPAGYIEKPLRLTHLEKVLRENVPISAVN